MADLQPGDKVYNPCSGEGGEARHLARLGIDVTCVDISDVGVAVADRLNKEQKLDKRIKTIRGDISSTQLPSNHFDCIFAPDCDGIHYADDKVELFARWRDILKPGKGEILVPLYLPGEGTPKDVAKKFDQIMEWADDKPTDLNADAYKAHLIEAGFRPEDIEMIPANEFYRERLEKTRDLAIERGLDPGPWLEGWLEHSQQAPNGFGFIMRAKRAPEGS